MIENRDYAAQGADNDQKAAPVAPSNEAGNYFVEGNSAFVHNKANDDNQNQNATNYIAVPSANPIVTTPNEGYINYNNYGQSEAEPKAGTTATEEKVDKDEIVDEHIRYLNEDKKRERLQKKSSSGEKLDDEREQLTNKNNIKKAVDKSADLIEARMNYEAGAEASDLAIELLKFSDHTAAQKKEYKENKKRAAKIKKSIRQAKKLEKKATKRYYSVLAKEAGSLTILKKAKKQEELGIVLTKLEGLIKERENLDARLTTLYKGAETPAGGRVRARAEKIKYKKAKKVRRGLRSSNARLEKMDVPQALKTKIRFLFNTKIVTEATLAYSKYLLSKLKPRGDAKAELRKNIKKASESLKHLEDSLKRMMSKAVRYEKSRKRSKRFLKCLIFFVLAALVTAAIVIGLRA